MSELERNEAVVHDAMCRVLGYISKDSGLGLVGAVSRIKDGIESARRNMHLNDKQVARLNVLFNVI